MNIKRKTLDLLTLIAGLSLSVIVTAQTQFPVTIENCGRTVTFEKPVRNAIVNNVNMAEMVHALGLKPYIKAMTGVTGPVELHTDFAEKMGDIPELSPRGPGLELLVRHKPDLFFWGWSYGVNAGGAITPERLEQYGIHSYILEESCIRERDDVPDASLDTLYHDLTNLSLIFGHPENGEALVTDFKNRIATIQNKVADQPKPKVFLFDGTPNDLVTSGSKGMGHAIIEAAGGINVAAEMSTSWAFTSIESVMRWNPDYLIFRQDAGMEQAIQSVKDHPVLGRLEAVRKGRYTSLTYSEMVPGVRVIESIERVARTIHPESFAASEADEAVAL
ncbi:ABC transporter substrate-binding protein [Parendozoicomonas haliclonae]|uniref:Vitamin B12-transporter protein BtuF n=1 Tax=Parendozoicomonas haliclonae TaxID=1960125 RepID=A0A1X7AM03_9GAMM|nr:ABC transporter substrate-binding protein [Parendozoicomonas haliclonae]SMA48842.1 vitamin B12-transporter protein BtuF [Parendozoicomonas haliclonae]